MRIWSGEEFHADLEWWRWAVRQRLLAEGVSLYSPFYDHVQWEPTRRWFSDATLEAIGGYCSDWRVWWRYDLSPEEKSRSSDSASCSRQNRLSIHLLEALAMVVNAYVMIVVLNDQPVFPWEPVLFRGDNTSAVTWVNKCGGTREPRAAFIMRWLGVLEMTGGWWCFEAAHIPGVENVLADGISRWARADIPRRLTDLSSPSRARWQEVRLGMAEWDGMFGDLAVLLSTVGVAPSTHATYAAA